MNKSRHQGGYALRWVGRTAVSRKRLLLLRECLEYALEGRRRIKEQLKRIGGMEFYDVHLSYIDLETNEEKIIRVKEQGGDSLIPDDPLNPGSLYTVGRGSSGHLGLYRLETQVTAGNGQLKLSGFSSNTGARESVNVGFDYFRANASRIQASLKVSEHNFHLHIIEAHNTGPCSTLTMAAFMALCSAMVGKALESQMVVLGTMSLGGNIVPVENLAESLQVAADAGAKRLLLPVSSVSDIPTIPGELFAKFQTSFYSDPTNAVFKALGGSVNNVSKRGCPIIQKRPVTFDDVHLLSPPEEMTPLTNQVVANGAETLFQATGVTLLFSSRKISCTTLALNWGE